MIGYSKKKRENYPWKCFWAKEKDTRVKLNPGIALIGFWRTGSRFHEYFHKKLSLFFLDEPIITWQSKFYAAFFSKLWKKPTRPYSRINPGGPFHYLLIFFPSPSIVCITWFYTTKRNHCLRDAYYDWKLNIFQHSANFWL